MNDEPKSDLLSAAKFAASVISAGGMYEISEQIAYEKLTAAISAHAQTGSLPPKAVEALRAAETWIINSRAHELWNVHHSMDSEQAIAEATANPPEVVKLIRAVLDETKGEMNG